MRQGFNHRDTGRALRQLRHVDEVTVWREARHPSSGALLERVPALRPGEQAYSCYLHMPKGGVATEAAEPPLLLLTAQVSCTRYTPHALVMHTACYMHAARCMHAACTRRRSTPSRSPRR